MTMAKAIAVALLVLAGVNLLLFGAVRRIVRTARQDERDAISPSDT